MSVFVASHYTVKDLESMEKIRAVFPEGKADSMNWLVLSTSGVHGSYTTLDELEAERGDPNHGQLITALIIQPRLCVLHAGEIVVEPDDVPYLRELVRSSLDAMRASQEGNV